MAPTRKFHESNLQPQVTTGNNNIAIGMRSQFDTTTGNLSLNNIPPYTPYIDSSAYKQGMAGGYTPPQQYVTRDEVVSMLVAYQIQLAAKNEFQKFLDEVFTLEEKIRFLEDIGYVVTDPSKGMFTFIPMDLVLEKKNAEGELERIDNKLETVFLKEIMIKFKNLLLAKATLKLKL